MEEASISRVESVIDPIAFPPVSVLAHPSNDSTLSNEESSGFGVVGPPFGNHDALGEDKEKESPSNLTGFETKIMYSRIEMETLRYCNTKQQKKLWLEIYSNFPAIARTEYGELGSTTSQMNQSRFRGTTRLGIPGTVYDICKNTSRDSTKTAKLDWQLRLVCIVIGLISGCRNVFILLNCTKLSIYYDKQDLMIGSGTAHESQHSEDQEYKSSSSSPDSRG